MCRPSTRTNRVSLFTATRHGSATAILLATTALMPASAFAQDRATTTQTDTVTEVGTIVVTGSRAEQQVDVSADQIQQRNTNSVTDLIDQTSGVSMNSLYSRPEVSVAVQGVAGHGRVSQQLEGISQNFHAFTNDFGQTGSIFVEPQFLRGIDVNRGKNSGTGSLGSLGSSVNFQYLDVDDVVRPGQTWGVLARGSFGITKYSNGSEPSGALFLAHRSDRWEMLLGGAHTENDFYRIGSNISTHSLMHEARQSNVQYSGPDLANDPYGYRLSNILYQRGPQRYRANGFIGMSDAGFSENQAKWLKEAAREPLQGTQKENQSLMMRLRHHFDDEHDQSLELFASYSEAAYETDQQPNVWLPLDPDATLENPLTTGPARWHDYPWSVAARLQGMVASLKWKGNFSDWLNPSMQVFHERQDRKQDWLATAGSWYPGEPMWYYVDIASTGLRLNNASHFDTGLFGALRLDAGIEYRRSRKDVESMTEAEFNAIAMREQGRDVDLLVFDPESRNQTLGMSLGLSTEGTGPFQMSASVGLQHVWLDVLNPLYTEGNIREPGTLYTTAYWRAHYRALGYRGSELTALAQAAARESAAPFKIDPDARNLDDRVISGLQQHEWTLKSANFGLSYRLEDTGLSFFANANYSERAPTSNEMYMSGEIRKGYFNANPNLVPESNISLQLGLDYKARNLVMDGDHLDFGVNYYFNRIKNYMLYGPFGQRSGVFDLLQEPLDVTGSGTVNNLNPFIKHGVEINLNYKSDVFYIRGQATLPIRHNNKICSWQFPSGVAYYNELSADGMTETIHRADGRGQRLCYSSWNWMEAGVIDPIRGSITAAVTPFEGRLELGGTLHYRGRQKSAYWYDKSLQRDPVFNDQSLYTRPIPEHSQFIDASLWPSVVKFDLFASFRIDDRTKFGVYMANVTDRMEATPTTWGYNFYPGRTFKANLEFRF